ncbi:hypothetical protein [Vibrio phage VP-HS15]|uniref:Pectate lyase superfamily protein domain-containing protein n=1 Tax=Vibrio phage VP-HS15 TaxID=2686284 RepID=A0A6B9LHC6_9CAUD|nr:hypothetical protein [Vibrio phage VP-HS15]
MALTNLTKPRARWATFKLKAANAISRSLYEKLCEQPVSIKSFGAKVDGTTDDTDAIRATIDFAHAMMNGNGKVFLTAGDIKYTSFYVPATVELVGAGRKTRLYPTNESGTYGLSVAANAVARDFFIYGDNSQGWGLQVSNNCQLKNVHIYNFKGDTTADDGIGLLLEGSWSSTFERVIVKQNRVDCVLGKDGTSLENNANTFYSCGFEYSVDEGFLIRKAAQTTLVGCWFGHHGIDNNDQGQAAFRCIDEKATVSLIGFYSEWTSIAVDMQGRTLELSNFRSSGNILIGKGKSFIQGGELFGYGGKIIPSAGSTGYALVVNCTHDLGYDIAPEAEDPEGRISLLNMGGHAMSMRQGLNIYGGKNLELNGGSGIEVNNGAPLRTNGTGGIGSNGGKIWVGGEDLEVVDSSRGLILKAPNTQRYRLQVDSSGNVTTTLVT